MKKVNGVEIFSDENEVLGSNWIDDIDYCEDFDDSWDEMSYNIIDDTPMKTRIKKGC